jgi:cardiolipin synthase
MESLVVTSPVLTLILFFLYGLFLAYTIVRIVIDSRTTSKALGYVLVIIIFPVFGLIFFYSFGINHRKRKHYLRQVDKQKEVDINFEKFRELSGQDLNLDNVEAMRTWLPMVEFARNLLNENLSRNTSRLLINGEEKFPELLISLTKAEKFIHMEYYAWEDDVRGNQIKDVLLDKIKEGIVVRILYDDYASRKIKTNIIHELKEAGAAVYPKIKIKLWQFANRINHRDHRKLVVIDGKVAFIGGINLSDRYDNSIDTGLFWRDTHIKICGQHANDLNRHFLVSWNSSVPVQERLHFSEEMRASIDNMASGGNEVFCHAIAGGPIYRFSNISLSYSKLFSMARKKLYITNPYFIPNETILNSLKESALSGVDVRIMLPEKSDSMTVGYASKFYFNDLLSAGIKIYLYRKGFVHAKTVVADSFVSVVGTANMDIRSFDLNFEIMTFSYGSELASELESSFMNDMIDCSVVPDSFWNDLNTWEQLKCAIARLISSFL